MSFEILTRFSPLALIPLLFACGVEIYHEPAAPVDHYVSMTLSQTYGPRDILANECIDLWDSTHGGSIDVDSPWLSHDLRVDWRNFAGQIELEISDAFGPLSSHSFDEDFFKKGGSTEFSIATEGQDYLLQLTGPYCSRRR
ncbi:MAG TPA: hypothetical protein VE954_25465 [Oligoflexus sp.]|uniref:hypothetical protein n=1 Tax=Oligoflexus sp. TaxID=1971216 RepID=UPI002D5A0CDD|nr:hypothetical protein [Oligoflexus sp.]HYX36470.1 hypothetical protein [Oligoflexus sp.]